MRYQVSVQGRSFEVELVDGDIRIDGEPVGGAELLPVPGSAVHHLLLSGRSYTIVARAADAPGGWDLHVDGTHLQAEVIDERTRSIRNLTRAAAATTAARPVLAPMPGLIVRVEVRPGELVKAGQGVVIMEAMKMENELRSECGGMVARVLVEPGQPVEKGAILIELTDAGREP
jgi:pyruvate carboxylase subunit B